MPVFRRKTVPLSKRRPQPSGRERFLPEDGLILSKTDLKGRVTYANRTFLEISGYSEGEMIGSPHSLVRHPDMPRAVFKLLWDRIQSGREIFAYVVNLCKNGDHYWVLAHVTPTHDAQGAIVGYHSNRQAPVRAGIEALLPLYRDLCAIESATPDRKTGLANSSRAFNDWLTTEQVDYDALVLSF